MSAKEEHVGLLDWGITAALLCAILAPWIIRFKTYEKANVSHLASLVSHNAHGMSLLFAGIFVARVLWHSFTRWDNLNEKQKPRVCPLGCVSEDQAPENGIKRRTFLLEIQNTSSLDVEECLVELIKISSGNNEWTCNAKLTFQPHEDNPSAAPKTLRPEVPYKVDIVNLRWDSNGHYAEAATKVNGKVGYWNRSPAFYEILQEAGEYILHVIISGKNMYPVLRRELKFVIDHTDPRMELMPPASVPNRSASPT